MPGNASKILFKIDIVYLRKLICIYLLNYLLRYTYVHCDGNLLVHTATVTVGGWTTKSHCEIKWTVWVKHS